MKEIIKNNDMDKNLPLGAENDPRAPWNEKEPKAEKLEVELEVIVVKKISFYMNEGYTPLQLRNVLEEYVQNCFPSKKNEWKVCDIDYEVSSRK